MLHWADKGPKGGFLALLFRAHRVLGERLQKSPGDWRGLWGHNEQARQGPVPQQSRVGPLDPVHPVSHRMKFP